MDGGNLFSNVRFFIAQCDTSDEIKNLLIEGGAKHINYLSESVTHVISDTNCPDAEEAVELFDKPVVTPLWVHHCLRTRRTLPPEAFSPLKRIFHHVKASFSRDLSRNDIQALASTLTFFGGSVTRHRELATHFIVASSKPTDFQDGGNSNDTIKIVAPDWILESVKQEECCDETRFEPSLLLPPPPPPPPKQPTPPPLSPPTQEKERNMIETNATKEPQAEANHVKDNLSRANNHIGDERTQKIDIYPPQPQIRTQSPSQIPQYQSQQQSQQMNAMQPLQQAQMGPRPRMSPNMIRNTAPRYKPILPTNIAQPRHPGQHRPRMAMQDNQQLRRPTLDQNNSFRKVGPYQVNPEMQHMQHQQPPQSYQQVEHSQGPMMGQPNRFPQPNMYQHHVRPSYQGSQASPRMQTNMMNQQPIHRFHDPNGQMPQPRPYQVCAVPQQQQQPIASPNYQQGTMQRPPNVYYNNNMNVRMPQQGHMMRPMMQNDQQMINDTHPQYQPQHPPQQQFYQQQQPPLPPPQQQHHNQSVRAMQPQPMQSFQPPQPPIAQPRLQLSPSIPNTLDAQQTRGPRLPSNNQLEAKSGPRLANAPQINERAPRATPKAPVMRPQPHPSIFDLEQKYSYAQMKAKVPDLTENVEYFGYANEYKPSTEKPFSACRFKLIEHEKVSEAIRKSWRETISSYGGRFIDDIDRLTHLICETQTTSEYQEAMERGVRCITMYWVKDVICRDRLDYPWRALHIPTAFKSSDKPLKSHIISTTNFEKRERSEIKRMIELTGAKYTDFLSSTNTLLICGKAGGDKFERAVEWKVAIANCHLLSDYLITGHDFSQMLDHAKYQIFNRGDQLKLESYVLIRKLMSPWQKPIPIMEPDDPPAIVPSSINSNEDSGVATGGSHNSDNDTGKSQVDSLVDNGEKTESTVHQELPSDGSETAKSGDRSTNEQPVIETQLIVGQVATTETKASAGTDKLPTKDDPTTATTDTATKKPHLRTSKVPVRVFATRLNSELMVQLRSHASELGLEWAKHPKESTHLLVDAISRSPNFVMAFSHASYILSYKWLTESREIGKLLDEKAYILQDPEGETKYSFDLVHSLVNRSKRPGLLFDNYVFFVTPTIMKDIKEMDKMIDSAGGRTETRRLPSRTQIANMRAEGKRFIIVADRLDSHLFQLDDYRDVDMVGSEFVISGILRQEVNVEAHRLGLRNFVSQEKMQNSLTNFSQPSPLKRLRQV